MVAKSKISKPFFYLVAKSTTISGSTVTVIFPFCKLPKGVHKTQKEQS